MRKVIVAFGLTLIAAAATARERSIRYEPPRPLQPSVLMSVNLDFGSVDLAPGAAHKLQLWMWQCCVYALPVTADVRYYMDSSDAAQLDGATGNLTISPLARGGTTLRVYADIEHGKRIISADVHIETPGSNPLRGRWRQTADISCDGEMRGRIRDHQLDGFIFEEQAVSVALQRIAANNPVPTQHPNITGFGDRRQPRINHRYFVVIIVI